MARDTDQTSTSREEVERNVEHELRQQADAYRDGTAGSPAAVARWLRILAEKLEAADQSSERRTNTPASTALSKEERTP